MRVTNSGKAAVAPNRNSSSEKKCSVEINSIETNSSHFKNFTLSLISLIHLDIGKDSALQHWKGKSFAIKISFPRKVITWICMDWIHMVGGTRSARKAFMCQTFSLLSCSSFKTFNPLWQKGPALFIPPNNQSFSHTIVWEWFTCCCRIIHCHKKQIIHWSGSPWEEPQSRRCCSSLPDEVAIILDHDI